MRLLLTKVINDENSVTFEVIEPSKATLKRTCNLFFSKDYLHRMITAVEEGFLKTTPSDEKSTGCVRIWSSHEGAFYINLCDNDEKILASSSWSSDGDHEQVAFALLSQIATLNKFFLLWE
jgi:hypothetical protein